VGKKLQAIAVLGLLILAGTAAFVTFRNRSEAPLSAAEKKPLSPAEKKQLFLAMTFRNGELQDRLRLTKYFSEMAVVEARGSAQPVDTNRTFELWRRACADKAFTEVKQALGRRYQFVPASYWDAR
jgi:hypothetical protein